MFPYFCLIILLLNISTVVTFLILMYCTCSPCIPRLCVSIICCRQLSNASGMEMSTPPPTNFTLNVIFFLTDSLFLLLLSCLLSVLLSVSISTVLAVLPLFLRACCPSCLPLSPLSHPTISFSSSILLLLLFSFSFIRVCCPFSLFPSTLWYELFLTEQVLLYSSS